MPLSDWKVIAGFGAFLIVLSFINNELAMVFGGAALIVLILRNPDIILKPFG